MKTKYLISFVAITLAVFGVVILVNNVFGQGDIDDSGIQYPVAELGNCADKAACGVYCDKPENTEACVNFAEKNNLMSKEEIETARNFMAAGSKGPGGCKTKDSCETYCNDISHIDECVSFAEKNNLMGPGELAEAKKVQAAIARGVKPPACGNKKQCDSYCEEPDHMEECISFGAEAGFIQGKELEDAQKMLAAIKKGVKPPPCKGKEACDEYCSTPDNMEVCINFAIEAGFMNEQEKADSQKMLAAIKKGIKPPNCKGKEECDSYCGQEEHFEECITFAEAAGFMSAEDAVMARKTGGKGPGDCKGKEECEAFCNNPDNQETCFNFAKEHGLISEQDLKNMEEGKQKMQEALGQAPPAVIDCLNSEIGADVVEKLKAGEGTPSRDIGDKMKACFEKMAPPAGPGEGGSGAPGMAPPGQTGPGGCTNPEECKTYCESHQEECQKFQPSPGAINPGDQTMPPPAGPGGCKSPEECQSYCSANPESCQNYGGIQPQGQYNYPAPEQNQLPPCEGTTCQSGPLPGQPLQQPLEGNTLLPGQPLNPTETPPPPPINEQPPAGQQPMQPPPESLPPPSGFNSTYLVGALLKFFFPFLNF